MRRACWIVGLGMLAALGGTPAQAVDPFFPTFGNDSYDVTHYDLSFDVDPVRNRLNGNAVISVISLAAVSGITLDLADLAVKEVRFNGVPSSFTHGNGKLRVRLPYPQRKGAAFKITVAYGGVPATLDDPTAPGQGLGLGWTGHAGTSYVVSEPVGASTWYPVNDQPTDKATYRFSVTAPKPYTAVANGNLESISDLGAKRRFIWKQREPMASYLAILDVARLDLERAWGRRGLPIRNYTTAKTPASTKAALRQVPAMLTLFESMAGPYPFSSYGAVVVDDPALYYALETQAMSTFPAED